MVKYISKNKGEQVLSDTCWKQCELERPFESHQASTTHTEMCIPTLASLAQ